MLTKTENNNFLFMVDLSPEDLFAVRSALIDVLCGYVNNSDVTGSAPAAIYWVLRFLLAEMEFNEEQLIQIRKEGSP